ncbi:hypothetical protein GCM10023192_81780 [Amycolatopsis samaneae]
MPERTGRAPARLIVALGCTGPGLSLHGLTALLGLAIVLYDIGASRRGSSRREDVRQPRSRQ